MIDGNENAFAAIAFNNEGQINIERDGLTIRQYFAAIFMQATLTNSVFTENAKRMAKEKGIEITDDANELLQPFAKLSVDCADILIAELNKEK